MADNAPFVPVERPRVAIASDGTLAAVQEPSRVTVVEVPSGAAFGEIGVDASATTETAWVGAPPRLVVLSRFAAHSTVHLIDPYGPRPVAEIRLEAPMRLFGAVGPHALAVGAIGTAVLTAGDAALTPYQFPARAVPVAAGGAAGMFVVALGSSIEEWDPQSRLPKRRLKLPRPAAITAVGGSDRIVWLTTRESPARIDTIALVNRGQPKGHDLPEPIESIAGHPRSDLVVCVGAETGRVYVVDLDGRSPTRTLIPDGGARVEATGLVVGRLTGVLVASTHRPIAVAPLEADEAAPQRPSAPALDEDAEVRKRSTLGADEDDDDFSSLAAAHEVAATAGGRTSSPEAAATAGGRAPSHDIAAPAIARTASQSFGAPAVSRTSSETFSPLDPADADRLAASVWRSLMVAWTRAVAAGGPADAPPPMPPLAPPLAELLARFELPPSLGPALALLYGAHLSGVRGAAPVDVARALDGDWDEALGTGLLAARGLALHADSRLALAPLVLGALDGRRAQTGTLVGEPGGPLLVGPAVAVPASPDEPLVAIAARCLASLGGAILAAHPHAEPDALYLEARAFGAAPLLRMADVDATPTESAIFVVADTAHADALGLPRIV